MPVRIGIIGSANMDLVAQAEHVPVAGENVRGGTFRMVPGGKGANQAVAVARAGAQSLFIGKVGDDIFGSQLLANLRADKVDVENVGIASGAASGTALIVVNAAGQSALTICPGANGLLQPVDIDGLSSVIAGCDAVIMQLEIPMETVARAIELARGAGVRVIIDAGPPRGKPPAELFKVSILSPNEAEAAALLGRKIQADGEAEDAARELLARGAEAVVMKRGEKGALLATSHGVEHFPAHRVNVVDTTAAGDAFTGVLAVFVAEGMELPDAIRLANRAGAIATTRLGAQPSIPTRAEIMEFDAPVR